MALGALAVGAVTVAVVTAVRGGAGTQIRAARHEARVAGERFLRGYVDPDGRVVRRDQGGDTVSEGQAYGMLVAVALGDRTRFQLIWGWTAVNLQRPDGLLSWHWVDGSVADPQSATDADLDAARALLLAAERFDRPGYRRQGLRIADAVLREETVVAGGRRVLVAGPWATSTPAWVNPSYLSPAAFALLARTGDPTWRAVSRSSEAVLEELTAAAPHLPPDWAQLSASGSITPAGAPSGGAGPEYGPDAARVPVRMAEDCASRGRRIAASMWPFLHDAAASGIVMRYDLSGNPLTDVQQPLDWVAAAAAARAAGHPAAIRYALGRADALVREGPTYYGAAWAALGRILLTTSWLGGCWAGT